MVLPSNRRKAQMSQHKPQVLRNLRIDEVSAVDKGAGVGTRIALFKRDDTPRRKSADDNVAVFETEIDDDSPQAADAERERVQHLVSALADLCVEASEGRLSRPAALRHLL